jgi:DNA polymerase I-like protein with 3'-5' exonuclease and polymerase domains
MLLQVHDELVFDAHSELEKIQPMKTRNGKCIQTRCTVNC